MASKRSSRRQTQTRPVTPDQLGALNRAKAAMHQGRIVDAVKAMRGYDRSVAEDLEGRLQSIVNEILGLG